MRWYKINKITPDVSKFDIATSPFVSTPIINEPTHAMNYTSSYIYAIFPSQAELIIPSNCHP